MLDEMYDIIEFQAPKGRLMKVVDHRLGRFADRTTIGAYLVKDHDYLQECNDQPSRLWNMFTGFPGEIGAGCEYAKLPVGAFCIYLGSTNLLMRGSSKLELYRIVLLGKQVYLVAKTEVVWCTPSEELRAGSDEDGKRD